MPAADNPLCLFVQLAAILGTCPAACADRLRLPPDIDACPLFDSSPCVDHGWPPYATLKPYYAEEASVTSSSRQTDHITGWRNPSPFSGIGSQQ
uniref:Putative secreted protein ovary overexpressed n=1 Tax=Rhipicephalus microplus TaxID=6941 RepID=A0A6M2D9J8_RHIMP